MRFLIVILCAGAIALSWSAPAKAMPPHADSAYDLINAVNALRASYGLPAYSVSSILMYTAQAQAEFMAATGNVTHSGPGGIGVTDRLLAAGYPLAGDLSLGGFRSENITSGSEGMTAQAAVQQWTGDAPHLNTMISPDLTEIGAGAAIANGRVYYVIDCARPTAGGAPQSPVGAATAPGVLSGSQDAGEAAIPAVVVSTPKESGEVFHEVRAGQTLWQIAIAYDVKIDEIKRLNNLSDNTIYPGDMLLIKTEAVQASATAESMPAAAPAMSFTPEAAPTVLPAAAAPTAVPSSAANAADANSAIMSFVIGLIALALLAGGYVAWRGGSAENSE